MTYSFEELSEEAKHRALCFGPIQDDTFRSMLVQIHGESPDMMYAHMKILAFNRVGARFDENGNFIKATYEAQDHSNT